MKLVKLKDIAKVVSGSSAPKEGAFINEGIPFIRVSHLDELMINAKSEFDFPKIAENKKTIQVPKNTILFAKSGMSIHKNRIYMTKNKVAIVNHLAGVILNEKVSSNYIKYYLNYYKPSKLILDESYPSIRLSEIQNLTIPLPPLPIQRKIADALDKAQELIDKRKKQIELLDEYVKSVFLDMFGDPVTNPMGWEVIAFESLISFITSGSRGWAKYYSNNGEIFIRINNVKNGKLNFDSIKYVQTPQTKEAIRTKVQENDLLISITADLGRTAVVDSKTASIGAYINQHLCLVRLIENCNPIFLAYYFESDGGKIQFNQKDQIGVKSGLNFNAIKSLKVISPVFDLQNRFAEIVQKTEEQKQKMQESLEKLEDNYNSISQRAFAGELFV